MCMLYSMRAWIIEQHGGSEVLKLKELPEPIADSNHVRVKVKAVGLNHLDVWVRKGVPGHTFPLPLIPGCDVAGEVDGSRVLINPLLSCGKCKSCLAGFPPTCPQFGLLGETANGGCAEWISVPAQNLLKIPDSLSFEEAVCLPIAYVTAWSMLTRKANIRKNDLVLVQAGGSGVSVAAIQIAKYFGATVITTVGNPEKASKAEKLGADFVIEYRKNPFKEELKKILKTLGRKGVDIALDHIGIDTFQDSIRALDWGGKLVVCGATTGSKIEIDLKPLFFKNLSLLGSTMGGREDLETVLNLVAQGKIKAIVDTVLPFSDLPKAYELLENRQVFGKIVVQV